MSDDLASWTREYTAVFEVYLRQPGEESLRLPRDLGQRALGNGLGILDALALHEQALLSLEQGGSSGVSIAQAHSFHREFLSPFDLELRALSDVRVELGRATQAVLALRSQLEAVNKELESFRYSISHDLRAPLRAIDGFGAILEREHAQSLDEEGRHCLEIIRSSTGRLEQLIEALLLLVRVGRAEMRRQSANVSNLAREVADELSRNEADRKVVFKLCPGLVADADPTLFRIVLESLLSNAWKFTARTPEAHVEFGAQEQPDGTTFFVRDNGIGFNMQYAGKLFTPFQRLHGENEFPGTGIGLAVVRRIVERHGGRVWIDAAVNKGATIFFTCPPERGRSAERT